MELPAQTVGKIQLVCPYLLNIFNFERKAWFTTNHVIYFILNY
jgi:hypothetical protein